MSISTNRRRAPAAREADAMVGARLLAILELGLRDGGAEIDVPERRRLELIREPALEEAQERQLRHALRPSVDRRVGHRPVDRQPEVAPQMLEDLLVLRRQPGAQLDEVRARDRDRLLAGLLRRDERRVVTAATDRSARRSSSARAARSAGRCRPIPSG